MIDWAKELQTLKARVSALEGIQIRCQFPLFSRRIRNQWVLGTFGASVQSGSLLRPIIRVAPEYPGAVVSYEGTRPTGTATGAWIETSRRTAYAWTSDESSEQVLLVVWRQMLHFGCSELRVRFIARVTSSNALVTLQKVYDTAGNDTNITPVNISNTNWAVGCVKTTGTFALGGLVTVVWALKASSSAYAYLADAELSNALLSLDEGALW